MNDRLAEIRGRIQAVHYRIRLEGEIDALWLCDEVERVKAEASAHLAVMSECVADEREATRKAEAQLAEAVAAGKRAAAVVEAARAMKAAGYLPAVAVGFALDEALAAHDAEAKP